MKTYFEHILSKQKWQRQQRCKVLEKNNNFYEQIKWWMASLVASNTWNCKSSVMWQEGESQSGGNKNTKHAKFSEKRTFKNGLKNVRFSEIWRALYSCYLRFDIRPFAILPTKWLWLNYLEARCLTVTRQTSCITFERIIQWIPNKLLIIINEPVSFKKDKHKTSLQHLKLYI